MTENETHWCQVRQDGIDYDIECGLCGYTERNVATSYEAARAVANAHEDHEVPPTQRRLTSNPHGAAPGDTLPGAVFVDLSTMRH
jgi:hypothetical protein